jgi:hypothetical protein
MTNHLIELSSLSFTPPPEVSVLELGEQCSSFLGNSDMVLGNYIPYQQQMLPDGNGGDTVPCFR